MGTDKRPSRGERNGRYGSDGRRDDTEWHERRSRDVERDYDRRWSDDRHRERFDERRDSPERGRKRRNSDRSDDEYDGDYPDQDYRMEQEEESKTIMLRGLSLHVTEDDIRTALEQLQGPQPVDIRLMKKRTGECCFSKACLNFTHILCLKPHFTSFMAIPEKKASYCNLQRILCVWR
uniref:RRM domain-containing protein n=1 Tax=Seriola dumerili TaxID=41447 RepID=A0A3B4UGX2_SERDU